MIRSFVRAPGSAARLSGLHALLLSLLVSALGAVARADPQTVRVATFNCSLNRPAAGRLIADLRKGDAQARAVAEILQIVRPDILLLNEFDYDAELAGARLFQRRYLAVPQNGRKPLRYSSLFCRAVNTGVPSGMDLNRDGRRQGPQDAFGFGAHPGQYGMLILSRFPIDERAARTFQKLRWSLLPGPLAPRDPQRNGKPYYDEAVFRRLRLPSKSVWDVPIRVGDRTLHLIASHPTPPVFDGPEDRNGCRNHDEIRLLRDLISPKRGSYLVDDQGRRGGLPEDALFVIAGDLNADPHDGASRGRPVWQLLEHPRVQATPAPSSHGAAAAAKRDGGANARHRGDPAHDTAAFSPAVGNLRVDYVLPSRGLKITANGVFWPPTETPENRLLKASDHRLVWIEVQVPGDQRR